MKDYSIHPVSENMLTVRVGNSIDLETNNKVFQLYGQLVKERHSSWLDIIPAYTTISIVYDVVAIREQHPSAFVWIRNQVEKILKDVKAEKNISVRHVQVPVCYDPEFALDADRIVKEKKISFEDIVAIHSSKSYHVFMIGFLPGFAYMGSVDQRIAIPRITNPRTHVPAGSVGIAGEQTGIYPLDSPGGWNIIGRTPLKIFDRDAQEPVLLQPGDEIKFFSITKKELESFEQSSFKLVSA